MSKDAVDDILEQWAEERPELDPASLGVVVRVMSLYRAFHRQATAALKPLGLELFEYDVLSALRRQGTPFQLSATALARETGLSTGAMTNRIDKLEARGLVVRKPGEKDRRSVVVSLSREGRRLIDSAIRLRLEAADASLQGITKTERRELADLLRKVRLGPVPVDELVHEID
jgi:DNA-binding MarR family transcriptional regulator